MSFPPLMIVPIEDVRYGDVLWGWEEGANYLRKGWHVEPEGQEIFGLHEAKDRWMFNTSLFVKGRFCPRYMLVEERKS
jgi:hypothetical protein